MSQTETFTLIALAPTFIAGLAAWLTATVYVPMKENALATEIAESSRRHLAGREAFASYMRRYRQ